MSDDRQYASSPCLWHEFDDASPQQTGSAPPPDDVAAWRRCERAAQIEARLAMPPSLRAELATLIVAALGGVLRDTGGRLISLYWPIRGEPDLRPLIPLLMEAGSACALPVVVRRDSPLAFRCWAPGERLERGVWNIPVPAAGSEVEPDVLIAPVVAFDRSGYRLGYGGGYFDRTLAALPSRRRVIGVGYSRAEIATIHPQPHDVRMDAIVTDRGTFPTARAAPGTA